MEDGFFLFIHLYIYFYTLIFTNCFFIKSYIPAKKTIEAQ